MKWIVLTRPGDESIMINTDTITSVRTFYEEGCSALITLTTNEFYGVLGSIDAINELIAKGD